MLKRAYRAGSQRQYLKRGSTELSFDMGAEDVGQVSAALRRWPGDGRRDREGPRRESHTNFIVLRVAEPATASLEVLSKSRNSDVERPAQRLALAIRESSRQLHFAGFQRDVERNQLLPGSRRHCPGVIAES